MQRVAFVMRLRPGADPAEYEHRHATIWPEMLAALRAAGAHNYSIYRHGDMLFAYLEADDFQWLTQTLAQDPVNARWQASMAPLIEVDADPATSFPPLLPEMFHMD